MKKHAGWEFLALCVCAVLLIVSAVQIHAVGNHLQYLIAAPPIAELKQNDAQAQAEATDADPPNAKALALLESLQTAAEGWSGIVEAYSMSGIAESAALTGDTGVEKPARLTALGADAFTLVPQYLRVGRLFYEDELTGGSRGILLTEQLALALFRVAEPIGRMVTLADTEFTVIGVVRRAKQVGDSGEYAAYVPLAALWELPLQLDALQVTAKPVAGAGAASVFAASMEAWQAGGTLINLRKEGMGALLPLRILLAYAGAGLFFASLGYWNRRTRGLIAHTRARLEAEYAARLYPRLVPQMLLQLLGYGALALAAALLIGYLVEPVYTFPEWVPAVLVEWKDIQAAFWQVWQSAASLRELRSPELIRIRYFGMVAGWSAAAAAVLATSLWARARSRFRREA